MKCKVSEYFDHVQDVSESAAHKCSPQDILLMHLESQEWSCLHPASHSEQFSPRMGHSGVFLPGSAGDHALLVWGGMRRMSEDAESVWHQVDNVYRYAHPFLPMYDGVLH